MSEPQRNPKPRRFRRYALIAALPLALLGTAGFLHAQHALSHDGHGSLSPATPTMMLDHVHKVLGRIGASAAQQARIDSILQSGALDELQNVPRMLEDLHREAWELLLLPAIDRAGIEQLRAGKIASIDAATRRAAAAMEDAASVLTAEQRAALAAEIRQHGG